VGEKIEGHKTSSEGVDKETNPYSNQHKERSSVHFGDSANGNGKQRDNSGSFGTRNKGPILYISILLKRRRILENQI